MVDPMALYIHREVIKMQKRIKHLTEVAKELLKLMAEVEKLLIRIVSLIGWILIIVQLLSK